MGRVRVHQHVNPLAPHFRRPPEPVDAGRVFTDPSRPLHLDIGCARGRFILKMAEVQADWNYLGVEIREALVTEGNRLAAEAGRTNLHYVFCNAMLWLGRLIEEVPTETLQMVTIQFPDPWFKKKHAKRRMVNAEMVETIGSRIVSGGRVFVQTDIEFLADEMHGFFRQSDGFVERPIEVNPFPVRTDAKRR